MRSWLLWLLTFPLAAVTVDPPLLRVSPAPGAIEARTVDLRAPPGTQLLAVDTPCPCVRVLDPLPLPADQPVHLTFTGALPGVKTLTFRTTAGAATMTALVDVAGAADGVSVLRALAARHPGAMTWIVVHDLGDGAANCGCSTGSLGGVEILAALPLTMAEAGLRPTAVLTGRVGETAAAMLTSHGWRRNPAEIPVGGVSDLRPGVLAVIASGPGPEHARLLHPVPGGLLAEVLVLDPQGSITEVARLPIDRSLPAGNVPKPSGKPVIVREDVSPSQDCAGCHASAHQTWLASRHASAWHSLTPTDRTTACASCHVTGDLQKTPVAGVHCQACHVGTAEHVAAGGRVKTGGAVDCRSCHDAAHDPGFDRVGRWLVVNHGK